MKIIVNNSLLAPVCLFVYAREDLTRQTVASLLVNSLASESELHVFCDGPRPGAEQRVQAVRDYVRTITGFARVVLHERDTNLGLSRSIIDGVTEMVRTHERVIVLEDDLKLSSGFLTFMNQSLQTYADHPQVMSVSGYSFPIQHGNAQTHDATFGLRASSWGWAIWRDRWEQIDWAVSGYGGFRWNLALRLRFNRGGSDLSHMLDRQMAGKIDSWAIRLCFHQFSHGLLDVFPVSSLVENVGFGEGAQHCRQDVRGWTTQLHTDPPTVFNLPTEVRTDPNVLRQFRRFNSPLARAVRVAKRCMYFCTAPRPGVWADAPRPAAQRARVAAAQCVGRLVRSAIR
ncbi:MAG: hypothetical protein RLZZ373_3433 [Pseudomonadota bacterium]